MWLPSFVPAALSAVGRPILAGIAQPKVGRKPKNWSPIDTHYEVIRQNMFTLFEDLNIAA